MTDRNGPAFVSPLGDRREQAVPCRLCRRPTWALRGECPSHAATNEAETNKETPNA